MSADFKIAGNLHDITIIAVGRQIRELSTLQKRFGRARWRKLKAVADVALSDGRIRLAEVHWYEAHGIGKVRMKIKKYLD
jgi:hypothetical protein